uniref:CDC42 effector protein (Rho GTPase binding) 2 n=1 Tax=Hucho hucho TaxID=62062 RepID=A0A4W5Q7L8_9TELE
MSTKAPIYLKRRSRKGKKEKLRDILSSDMISPPLGDFRHTIHIGSGGGDDDLFGDLSFLQGKFHLLPGQQGHNLSQCSSMYAEPFQFSRTASDSGHTASSESSPLLKNALSLPVIEGVQAITLPNAPPPPKPPRLLSSGEDVCIQDPYLDDGDQELPYLSHAGSLLSLHLDLGPSILDDVLQIMDSQRLSGLNGTCLQGGRQGLYT